MPLIVPALVVAGLLGLAAELHGEWYVAGQFGVNFADRLHAVRGTGALMGENAPDFDLANSYASGAKVGYYPGSTWLGLELDALLSTPHVRNLEDIPGIHLRVTNIGLHLLIRYPGLTFQPYLGLGPAVLVSRLSGSPTTQADTNVTVGLNALTGLRAFVTPTVALFSEYKFTMATLRFTDTFGPDSGFHGDYRVHQLVLGVSYHF